MDVWTWVLVFGVLGVVLKVRGERRRIALLAAHLKAYPIERLMTSLSEGYQRALAETDAERQEAMWQQFRSAEDSLVMYLGRWTQDMAALPESQVRVCRWALPALEVWWPAMTLDLRTALALHVDGLRRVAENAEGLTAKARARRFLAEMLLLQHTCHWYCRSLTVASARLLARQKTRHADVLAAVTPQTRERYRAWSGL